MSTRIAATGNTDAAGAMQLDDNVMMSADGALTCAHCGAGLGQRDEPFLALALQRVREPEAAGPQIRARAALFVDCEMVLRQSLCPGCHVVLLTEIVPADEPSWRSKQVQS